MQAGRGVSARSKDDRPRCGMVLAAGLGLRMRPITDTLPKPLIPVAGRTLLDRAIDRLEEAGVENVVVNVHYLAEMIERHVRNRSTPRISVSVEEERLETGGGVAKALPLLGSDPFFVVNGDALWIDGPLPTLKAMTETWNDDRMDALLLMHPTVTAHGYEGAGDFMMDTEGRLIRRPEGMLAPYLFAGVQILHPRLFERRLEGPFSLNLLYDEAIDRGRLFGLANEGSWFHVGTPDDLAVADKLVPRPLPGRHPA